jgi:hypothetical protein
MAPPVTPMTTAEMTSTILRFIVIRLFVSVHAATNVTIPRRVDAHVLDHARRRRVGRRAFGMNETAFAPNQ